MILITVEKYSVKTHQIFFFIELAQINFMAFSLRKNKGRAIKLISNSMEKQLWCVFTEYFSTVHFYFRENFILRQLIHHNYHKSMMEKYYPY